jgi:zinc transporter ZupT
LGWYGLVYGVADALLLTVIPVAAVGGWWAFPGFTSGRVLRGAAAFAGSLLVTALYHAGFTEFHGAALLQPLIGNAIVTAGYVLTGNPATPLLSHVLMHAAAVVHGMEATVQLPPHY